MLLSAYNKYAIAVERLMDNDKNSSLDTLLKECDSNIITATNTLKNILNRIIYDEELQGSELKFYKNVLTIL